MDNIITGNTAEIIKELTAASLEIKEIGSSTFILAPKDYTLHNVTGVIEQSQVTPSRKSGTVHLADVASLMQYMGDQKCPHGGYVYADLGERTITAVFNDHKFESAAGWRDHRAVFSAAYTPEFKRWLARDKQQFTQTEFAEFIEDNFPDIAGDQAQTLLTVATTLSSQTGINFSSSKRLQDGQNQLHYSEVIDTKAGADGAMTIPQKFSLGVRIFVSGGGYSLTARLKFRIASGGVKFWYELERPERAVEDAFGGYVEALRETSGYTVLLGKA